VPPEEPPAPQQPDERASRSRLATTVGFKPT
jgi:hypothetical protein